VQQRRLNTSARRLQLWKQRASKVQNAQNAVQPAEPERRL
jgi:hypothetical protein